MATPKKLEAPTGHRAGNEPAWRIGGSFFPGAWKLKGWASIHLFLLLLMAVTPAILAQPSSFTPVPVAGYSNRYHSIYLEAKRHWQMDTNRAEVASEYAHACFERGDYSANDKERAALAEEGIAASHRAIALDPKSAAARHYLGLNLGQLARTKLFSALGLLDDMEATWKKSIELDEKFRFAAAHRSLGLLYLDAPGWPLSLGSRARARQHLKTAVELGPEYPDNQLCWLEALLRWGEMKSVRSQLGTVEDILKTARAQFTGDAWSRDWLEWEDRWRKIKAKAAVVPARSPRGRQ